MGKADELPRERFFSPGTLASVLGISGESFRRYVRDRLGSGFRKGSGARTTYYGPEAVGVHTERRIATEARRVAAEADPDPMLAGSASPALERYRDERAKLAKLDRLEREGTLVEIGIVNRMIDDVVVHLRRASERLQTECGDRAYEIYTAALAEAEAAAARHFKKGDADDGKRTESENAPESGPEGGKATLRRGAVAKTRKHPAAAHRRAKPCDTAVAGGD